MAGDKEVHGDEVAKHNSRENVSPASQPSNGTDSSRGSGSLSMVRHRKTFQNELTIEGKVYDVTDFLDVRLIF